MALLLLFTIGSVWAAVTVVKSFRTVPKRNRDTTEEELMFLNSEFEDG
jgi:hypothetical protein